jgi:hypothetical protein
LLDSANFINADTSILINQTLLETLHASVSNYLQALAAASLVDTGTLRNNSLFVSPQFINLTLQPNDIVATALVLNRSYDPYYPSYYQQFFICSGAQILRALPWDFMSVSMNKSQPALISMVYNCHFQQQKHLLNFVICDFTLLSSQLIKLFFSQLCLLPTCHCSQHSGQSFPLWLQT